MPLTSGASFCSLLMKLISSLAAADLNMRGFDERFSRAAGFFEDVDVFDFLSLHIDGEDTLALFFDVIEILGEVQFDRVLSVGDRPREFLDV